MGNERMLTMREAAAYLGISLGTLRRLVARGAVVAYRIGERRLHLRQADLEAYIASRAVARGKERT